MKTVSDFIISALPWIASGMFVAVSCVNIKIKKEGQKPGKLFSAVCYVPSICFIIDAILEMADGNTAKGTTWLVLGIDYLVLNCLNTSKHDDKDGKESN